MSDRRAVYEAGVRALADVAGRLREAGQSEEQVARSVVARRNELKRDARVGLPQHVIDWMEQRNMGKYGDPIGPSADALFKKYGTWAAVAEAAARPADLRDILL